jgi:hypothetical protein
MSPLTKHHFYSLINSRRERLADLICHCNREKGHLDKPIPRNNIDFSTRFSKWGFLNVVAYCGLLLSPTVNTLEFIYSKTLGSHANFPSTSVPSPIPKAEGRAEGER